jgi:predicted regulator of Ras-like GTPase activity (Roadblock/LC7/MglB family)
VGGLLGLGWIALQGGDRESATRRWQAAQAIAPRDPRVVAVGRQLQAPPAAVRDAAPTASAVRHDGGRAAARDGDSNDAKLPVPDAAAASPPGARALFAAIEQGGARFALLVDDDGLVLAGRASGAAGDDRSDELGAELSGLSGEAERAMRQLQLGGWERLLVECDAATLALAPSALGSVTLVATPAGTPAGLPRLLLDRARRRANDWLGTL